MVPGELSIVTGVPNSGKSEWIDALLCNLAEQCGWSFALCSMEKKVNMRSVPIYMHMSTMPSTTYPTCSATHMIALPGSAYHLVTCLVQRSGEICLFKSLALTCRAGKGPCAAAA